MNLNQNPFIFIFSVFRGGETKESNEKNHYSVLKYLQEWQVPCIEITGKYKGQFELSILIEGEKYRGAVEQYCSLYNQESYIESHPDRTTFLITALTGALELGVLKPVSQEVAQSKDSYSYNRIANQYYIIE